MEIFIAIIAFIIGVLFTRWVFKIDEIILFQSKQYRVLRQIALKLGVEEDKLFQIDDPREYEKRLRLKEKDLKKQSLSK